MNRELLKSLLELITEEDINTIYQVIIKFIPEDEPLPDEIKSINLAKEDIEKYGTIPHDKIDWD